MIYLFLSFYKKKEKSYISQVNLFLIYFHNTSILRLFLIIFVRFSSRWSLPQFSVCIMRMHSINRSYGDRVHHPFHIVHHLIPRCVSSESIRWARCTSRGPAGWKTAATTNATGLGRKKTMKTCAPTAAMISRPMRYAQWSRMGRWYRLWWRLRITPDEIHCSRGTAWILRDEATCLVQEEDDFNERGNPHLLVRDTMLYLEECAPFLLSSGFHWEKFRRIRHRRGIILPWIILRISWAEMSWLQ